MLKFYVKWQYTLLEYAIKFPVHYHY